MGAKAKKKPRRGSWQAELQTGLLRYGFERYADYLASDLWTETKRRFYDSLDEPPACSKCQATERLQVHHLRYRMLGREPVSDLTLLCDSCHRGVHRFQSRRGLALDEATEQWVKPATTKRERQLRQLESFAKKLGMRVVPVDEPKTVLCPFCGGESVHPLT